MTEEGRIEYTKYMNEQLGILDGHFQRIMLRCHNKIFQIIEKEDQEEIIEFIKEHDGEFTKEQLWKEFKKQKEMKK